MTQEEFDQFDRFYYAFETELYDNAAGRRTRIQFRIPITDSVHDSIKDALINIAKRQVECKNIRIAVDYAIDHVTGPVWRSRIRQQLLFEPVVIL